MLVLTPLGRGKLKGLAVRRTRLEVRLGILMTRWIVDSVHEPRCAGCPHDAVIGARAEERILEVVGALPVADDAVAVASRKCRVPANSWSGVGMALAVHGERAATAEVAVGVALLAGLRRGGTTRQPRAPGAPTS